MRRTLIATALLAGLSGPAVADEYATYLSLFVTPAGASSATGCQTTALLNLPASWQAGDAVVVLLTTEPEYSQQRDSLIAEILAEQAGVLEVPSASPAACHQDGADALGSAAQAASLDLLYGGLLAARQQGAGGLVVAIGHGREGRLALAAADEAEASARLGSHGPRFAAALALGDERPRLRLGAAVAAPERAEARLGLLCDALGRSNTADGLACATELRTGLASVRVALQR